jgi:hypothetical protein
MQYRYVGTILIVLMAVFLMLWGFNKSGGISSPPPPPWTGGGGSAVTCVEDETYANGNHTRLDNGLNERVQWHVVRSIPGGRN